MKYSALHSLLLTSFLGLSGSLYAQDSQDSAGDSLNQEPKVSVRVDSVKAEDTGRKYVPANVNINNYWSLGIGLMHGKPLKEFDRAQYRNGLALHLEVFSPSIMPEQSWLHLKLGGHLDGMVSGWESEEITLQDPAGALADYSVTNYSFAGHLIGRITTKQAKVMPYIDGFVGTRWFGSSEKISLQEEYFEYEEDITQSLASSFTFTYGASVGALVQITDLAYLDFRVSYSNGSRTDFVNLSTVDVIADAANYRVDRSRSPLLFTQVSLVFQLGGQAYSYGGRSASRNSDCQCNCPSHRNYENYDGNRDNNRNIRNRRDPRRSSGGSKSPKIKRNPKIENPNKKDGSKS